MKKVGRAMLQSANPCGRQESGNDQPAAANVYRATYPRLEAPFINECPTIH